MRKPEPQLEDLKPQYAQLFASAKIRSSFRDAALKVAKQIHADEDKYKTVSDMTGVPWFWIAITHHMEAGGNFHCHLHNGDSLAYRTYHVPKGRPLKGNPVFSWTDSAVDALTMHGLDEITSWTIESCAYYWERYNGWGYRWYHPNTLSAYLWSGTQHYSSGKYIEDNKWSDSAVSGQLGAIAILKALLEIDPGLFEVIDDAAHGEVPPSPAPETPPQIGPEPNAPNSFPKAHEIKPSWWQEKWKHLLSVLGLGGVAGASATNPKLPTADQLFSAAQTYGPQVKGFFASGLVVPAIVVVVAYIVLGHVLPSLSGGSDASNS